MEDAALWHLLALVAAFYLLIRGAEHLVDGASATALRLGVAPLVVGLTIVAFGTSAPELATSLSAAFRAAGGEVGAADVAVGNVVGSNICNLALILGVAAVLRPLKVHNSLVRREIPFLVAFTIAFVVVAWQGRLETGAGLLLLGGFVAFLVYVAIVSLRSRQRPSVADAEELDVDRLSHLRWSHAVGLIVLGGILLAVGADVLVESSMALAKGLGVSDAIVGLTVVAIGTSTPELAATWVAARHGRTDLALGNVVGSNIFNIGLVVGLPAAWVGIPVNPEIAEFDMPIMAAITVALLPMAMTRRLVSRREGYVLLVGYGVYLLLLLWDRVWS